MKNCMECNHEFTCSDRLKTFKNLSGHLKCPKCNSVYKQTFNVYKFIYYMIVYFAAMMTFQKLTLNNYILKVALYTVIIVSILFLFDILPHRWHRYKKIE